NRAHRRRGTAERHVRFGRTRPELSGRQRNHVRGRYRRMAGGAEKSALDHRRRIGHVFSQVEASSTTEASRQRVDGISHEVIFVKNVEGGLKMALDSLKFVIEEEPAPKTKIRVIG